METDKKVFRDSEKEAAIEREQKVYWGGMGFGDDDEDENDCITHGKQWGTVCPKCGGALE